MNLVLSMPMQKKTNEYTLVKCILLHTAHHQNDSFIIATINRVPNRQISTPVLEYYEKEDTL